MMQDALHHTESEQSVLGALMLDNEAIDRIPDLKVEHFFVADHRVIYSTIRRLVSNGKPADVVTVFEALTNDGRADDVGGLSYLNALAQNTPSAANIKRYAEIVQDRALRRGLVTELSRLSELAGSASGQSATDILDAAQSAISTLAEKRVRNEAVLARDALLSHIDVLDGRQEKKIVGISTGLELIDEALSGGMRRGNLIIVAGRPGMGKTALALNIGTVCARDYGVLVQSQEMSNGELLDRNLAALGGINLGSIITGQMTQDEWARITAAAGKINDMNLLLDDQSGLTLLEVRMKAISVKRKHGLDVLIVDYLQLMYGSDSKDNRNTQIEEITRGLKTLAKELNIVVIALSQLNRTGASGRPRLADLRDSGAIEQDADVVMFVHRDEVLNPESHMAGLAEIIIGKNRQGPVTDILLEYTGHHTRFSDYYGNKPEAPRQQGRKGLARNL